MKSKKELIVKAICEMDISLLEVLLDDNRTYQDVPKEVFISKLEGCFEKLKSKKNNLIKSYKGKCISLECPNKGCTGYSFVNEHSKEHIDLIFEETESDYLDIYNCGDFKTEEKIGKLKYHIEIEIDTDEKALFLENEEHFYLFQKCKSAITELEGIEKSVLTTGDYLPWLDKYKSLNKSIPDDFYDYDKINEFHSLFRNLKRFSGLLHYEAIAEIALSELDYIDKDAKYDFFKWKVKYKDLSDKLKSFSVREDDIKYKTKPYNWSYIISIFSKLRLSILEYKNIFLFTINYGYGWRL